MPIVYHFEIILASRRLRELILESKWGRIKYFLLNFCTSKCIVKGFVISVAYSFSDKSCFKGCDSLMHCTVLNCTVLNCTALYYTAQYCPVLHCNVKKIVQYRCIYLGCSLQCLALQCLTVQYYSLHNITRVSKCHGRTVVQTRKKIWLCAKSWDLHAHTKIHAF